MPCSNGLLECRVAMGFSKSVWAFWGFAHKISNLGFYRYSIFLWPNFDNGMRGICVGST